MRKSLIGVAIIFFLLLTAAARPDFTYTGPETELLEAINLERATHNLPALSENRETARLAKYKSEEMAKLAFFGHGSRIYGEPHEMLTAHGIEFSTIGVTLANGTESAADTLTLWLNSPAHRETLLNIDFTDCGIGIADNDGTPIWTVILTG